MPLKVLVMPTAEPTLLQGEPADISDVREVRHWIRVYSSLLELALSFPPGESPDQITQRFVTWHGRLDFWQGRARELSNPSAR